MHLQAMCMSERGWEDVDDLATVVELRHDPDRLVWIESDVSNASEDDLQGLAKEFDLDELAIEDALEARQRPKLEPYPGHLLVVLYQLDEVDDQLEQHQIAAFAGRGFMIVLHHGAQRLVGEVRKRIEGRTDEFADEMDTVDDLLHALLDAAVDDYELKAAALGDEVEELEMQGLAAARAVTRSDTQGELPDQAVLYTVKQ